jgi:tryptophanyl-tRNA synthetase
VYDFHKLYTDPQTVKEIDEQCRSAGIGCVECKKIMARGLIASLEPIREKRAYYEQHPEIVEEIMIEGSNKARLSACETMEVVRAAVKI